jgi:hypothetical protein
LEEKILLACEGSTGKASKYIVQLCIKPWAKCLPLPLMRHFILEIARISSRAISLHFSKKYLWKIQNIP